MIASIQIESVPANQVLKEVVENACRRIAPLWTLKNFVAANPFLGLSGRHFIHAAGLMRRLGPGEMLMPAAFYLEQIESGRIQGEDFQAAIKIAWRTLPAVCLREMEFDGFDALKQALATNRSASSEGVWLTFAEFLDSQNQHGWAPFVVEEISKWCSAFFDEGQCSWRLPWRNHGLFAAWKAAARLDANPELMGCKGFREFAAGLPEDHWEVIRRVLEELGVPEEAQPDFLHRELMSLRGWSGYVQFMAREKAMAGETDDSLSQLLAIRLAYDFALLQRFGDEDAVLREWEKRFASFESDDEIVASDLLARFVAQQALECGYQRALLDKLRSIPVQPSFSGGKLLQAVFCIDVRSEVFRRALETQSNEIETIGFAGFFGVAFDYWRFGRDGGGAQCPVLLAPKIKLREAPKDSDAQGELRLLGRIELRGTLGDIWRSFKTEAVSCFSFVESAGLGFGAKLVQESLGLGSPRRSFASNRGQPGFGPRIERETFAAQGGKREFETGISPADQITLAAGALKNMGLTANFARVVLICGHGAACANNPYSSALDCGACGGHAGEANARVAVAILNQPAVRDGLRRLGIDIPAETLFVAGLHNTTTDEIVLYDLENCSQEQQVELEKIRGWLAGASSQARRERAASLGLGKEAESALPKLILQRSRDWSQVRPEWGLAGNAAFIAAPRDRTRGLNLGGRIFLHNYDSAQDRDKSTLELILTAPMVVASWINLQYYGSTVDNRLFGSGNKVLHNVVGTFGVWQGNGGDLQPGLPLQSLHNGARWAHEPLRLSVLIEAGRGDIETVLAKQPGVRELVENGWVCLFALEAGGPRVWRYSGGAFVEENN